jgi:endonuclease-8
VQRASGNTKVVDPQRMAGRTIRDLRSWGKHFLIVFDDFTVRVHFMLFGSYAIDDAQGESRAAPVAGLRARARAELLRVLAEVIEGDLDAAYDWSADVMSPTWNPRAARRKLVAQPDTLAADALLDQAVFSGVGNIIKNEVLHRIRVHPESTIGALPSRKLGELIKEARNYSFDFLEWKKAFVLAQALPGAYQAVLPARRHPPELPQAPGARAAACVLVRDVPAPLRVSYACAMTERDPTTSIRWHRPHADTRRWLERAVIGLNLCPSRRRCT